MTAWRIFGQSVNSSKRARALYRNRTSIPRRPLLCRPHRRTQVYILESCRELVLSSPSRSRRTRAIIIITMLRPKCLSQALLTTRHAFQRSSLRTSSVINGASIQSRYLSTSITTSIWRRIGRMTGILSNRLTWGAPAIDVSRQWRGMKVRSSVKKLCDGCKVRLRSLHYTTSGWRWSWLMAAFRLMP